ncbi:MAG: glycosyltransferase family 9 protein [Verrucomicrobiota bacterium]
MDILIVRLSAIGDIVMSTSLIKGLRLKYPNARLVWLTEGLGEELLQHHPDLDEVWLLPRKKWQALGRSFRWIEAGTVIRGFCKKLRSRAFDLVLDLQGIPKSAVWTRIAEANRRVILNPRDGAQLLIREQVSEPQKYAGRYCREYRAMARYLELPESAFAMSLRASPDGISRAESRWSSNSRVEPRVFFFPFTTRPQKHWSVAYWNVLAERLTGAFGAKVVVLGGPGDLEGARAIVEGIADAEIVAGWDSDLDDKMALIPHADVCVGVDTGLTHMSLAFGRPTVGIFGSTCPYEDLGDLPGKALYDHMECSPCRRHPTCDGRFDCMKAITVERVLAAMKPYLERV